MRNLSRLLSTAAISAAVMTSAQAWAGDGDNNQKQGAGSAQNNDAGDATIVPNAGMIRSFYGPATGAAGMIRSFDGEVEGQAGMIRSFEGDVEGRAGMIRSFAGNVRGMAGMIRSFESDVYSSPERTQAFWGKLTPNAGMIRSFAGDFESHAGMIRSFSGKLDAHAGMIRSFAGMIRSFDNPNSDHTLFLNSIRDLIAVSEKAVGAEVQQRTGKSFDEAVTQRLLTKYGLDLNDPSTATLNELGIELFLLDWYDNVSAYSGVDSVDRWMNQIGWSPALTQTLGAGYDSKIGLLDFTVTGSDTANLVKVDGISKVAGGHGSGVISLITGAHDGQGVMGIAPNASVVAFNPFDETNTAGWSDIRDGVKFLVDNKASVINMSLGVSGWTLHSGWNDVFSDKDISKKAKERVFVLSAGNDGITQTQNVEWNFKDNPNIIVVGSVDPNNVISGFSNRPGNACLVGNGKCESSANLLMNRFIVAPGEMTLVSDGAGGVTRMSGTSFAAPLVSGTIALIHDRWPWLAKESGATTQIVLNSARDLGEKGTDAVYGVGLLDVQAALSPLSWEKLNWKVSIAGSKPSNVDAKYVRDYGNVLRQTFEALGGYVVVFDDIAAEKGKGTYRDFTIPLSSKLAGQTVGKSEDLFMAYLQNRFWEWVATTGQTPVGKNGKKFGFRGTNETPLFGFGEWQGTLSMAPNITAMNLRSGERSMDTMLSLQSPEQTFGFALGQGNGARGILGQGGFALASDHSIDTGGVNPLLSLASGGAFGAFSYALSDKFSLEMAFTQQETDRNATKGASSLNQQLAGVENYQAGASVFTLGYKANDWADLELSYTQLEENSGLLGMQSLDSSDLRYGTTTDAMTLAADVAITPTLSLAASGTLGRTRHGDLTRQNMAVSDGGLVNSAFQVALSKAKVFGANDVLRFSLAQPLHIESGSLDYNSVEVVDRQTGELGDVVQTVELNSGSRQLVAEAIYGTSLLNGSGSFNLFGKAMLNDNAMRNDQASVTAGASFSLAF